MYLFVYTNKPQNSACFTLSCRCCCCYNYQRRCNHTSNTLSGAERCERNHVARVQQFCAPVRQDPVLGTTITQNFLCLVWMQINKCWVVYECDGHRREEHKCALCTKVLFTRRGPGTLATLRNPFTIRAVAHLIAFWSWWLPVLHSVSSTDIFPRKKPGRCHCWYPVCMCV